MKSKKVPVKEEKSGQLQKLKNRIRKLEKENKQLKSKLNTAENVLERNLKFLKGSTEDVTLEDLLEAAKTDKTLKEVKQEHSCPKCGAVEGFKLLSSRVGNIEVCLCGHRGRADGTKA